MGVTGNVGAIVDVPMDVCVLFRRLDVSKSGHAVAYVECRNRAKSVTLCSGTVSA